MEKICDENKCKGCGLCQNVCPQRCITLDYNRDGFITPVIDNGRCINCKLCQKVCISKDLNFERKSQSIFYYAHSRSKSIVSNSSSGGIFLELAKYIIALNGIVYGAVLVDAYNVRHIRAVNYDTVLLMRYSKYTQSDTSDIYIKVLKDLEQGNIVLFTGTPCQIYSLKKYLQRDFEKLITMDVLCDGVMSSKFVKDYINYIIGNQNDIKNKYNVCWRSKKYLSAVDSFVIERNNTIIHHEPFHGVVNGIGGVYGMRCFTRSSCNNCCFQSVVRIADISIGDFVSYKTNIMNNSLVVLNTEKGKNIFKRINVIYRELKDNELSFNIERLEKKAAHDSRYDYIKDYYLFMVLIRF